MKQFLRDELGTAATFLRLIADNREPPSLTPAVLREQAARLEVLCEHLVTTWVDAVLAEVLGRLPDGHDKPPAA